MQTRWTILERKRSEKSINIFQTESAASTTSPSTSPPTDTTTILTCSRRGSSRKSYSMYDCELFSFFFSILVNTFLEIYKGVQCEIVTHSIISVLELQNPKKKVLISIGNNAVLTRNSLLTLKAYADHYLKRPVYTMPTKYAKWVACHNSLHRI